MIEFNKNCPRCNKTMRLLNFEVVYKGTNLETTLRGVGKLNYKCDYCNTTIMIPVYTESVVNIDEWSIPVV